MLNKELLMTGGAEELWTLHLDFTGDSYIDLILWDSTDQTHILWEGNPNADIGAIRIAPKSTLLLTQSVGIYRVKAQDGCIAEDYSRREIAITVYQSEAYLEMLFNA